MFGLLAAVPIIFFIVFSFFPIIFIIVILNVIKKVAFNKSNTFFKNNIINLRDELMNSGLNVNELFKEKYKDVSKSQLADFDISDINMLKDYCYDIFERFEKAYSNLDYNTMSLLSTTKLYNNYYTNISLNLKYKKAKKIEDIKRKKVVIFELYSSDYKQVISALIEVSYYNYLEDTTGKTINPEKDLRKTEKFEVIFKKEFDNQAILKCPNCGASVTGSTCKYCRTDLRNTEFKIDSIKKVVE